MKVDLTGKRFGRLLVRSGTASDNRGRAMWECLCECGTVTTVRGDHLRRGKTTSCGCYRRDFMRTHGEYGSSEYVIWQGMKQRCLNPKNPTYPRYGGRGIQMHPEWAESFAAFLRDVGRAPSRRHSIDRINVNGHYVPSNVRWATPKQQARNKRNGWRHVCFMSKAMAAALHQQFQ